MDLSPENSLASKSTADYLADREGLDGTARIVFLDLLRNVFGFRMTTTSRIVPRLVTIASVVAVLGSAIELRSGMKAAATLPWLSIGGIGWMLAIIITNVRRRQTAIDWEFEWRSYCMLVRPRILLRQPGLLDRNLRSDRGAGDEIGAGHNRTLLTLLHERNLSFWSPVAIGWAAGSTTAIIWRVMAGHSNWLWLFSLCGMIIAPLVWNAFRLTVFRRLRHSPHDER